MDRLLWRSGRTRGQSSSRVSAPARDQRPAILRPGGHGDLIMLCVAAKSWVSIQELLLDRREPFRRNGPVICGSITLLRGTPPAARFALRGKLPDGRPTRAVTLGLSQAVALRHPPPRAGKLIGFDTNRAANSSDLRVP